MLLRNLYVALAALTSLVGASDPRLLIRDSQATNLVTYDEHSLLVEGKRVIFFSGSFHPFRLPVPGLWRDIFEKIRALGYNGVTFYINWALLEGKQGEFLAPGVFDLQPFFDAAKETGIWLNARPGPYINAEVSGGGFPGWLKRDPAALRTDQQGYLNTTNLYMSKIGALIAANQITNGGPVILVQPENEYTYATPGLEPDYMAYVEQQLRDAGIVVPLMSNDAYPAGNFAPGSGTGAVDIYGYDGYPLGFNCGDPSNWGTGSLPTNYGSDHQSQSPSGPNSIVEFQGGSFDPWGGVGFELCADFLNWQFENVFYKNNFGMGVKMLNLYMTYGGFNWGNLGYDVGYSSYDYGAAIALDRTVTRQKYAEAKLIANSLRASPAFLTSVAQEPNGAGGAYTGNNNIVTSAVLDSSSNTKFYVQRQYDYYSMSTSPSYQLTLPTSQGNITIPQLGGQLSLEGRESKISVTDFSVGGTNLLYSSADLFTWQQNGGQTTLVLFGNDGETHEFAISKATSASQIQGSGANIQNKNGAIVVNTQVSSSRQIIQFNNGLNVHIVDRPSAYGYWVIYQDGFTNNALPIVNMPSGYLVRNIQVSGSTVNITADLNQTSTVEVIGVPSARSIILNGNTLQSSVNSETGILSATATYSSPQFSVPDLSQVTWYSIDSLPEIQTGYDDSKWPSGDLTYTNNTNRTPLNTPTSLYAADYGFNTGSLIYRGHFVSNGQETQLKLSPQGGNGFGSTVWLNGNYLGNFLGTGSDYYNDGVYNLPTMTSGESYVLTVAIDHMGNQENYEAGGSDMKQPRGVMQYTLLTNGGSRPDSVVTWKLTGNLGGEDYYEKELGPLNEGAFFAQRQGYYLPGAPTTGWSTSQSPQSGITEPGVRFYTTTFNLNFPEGYDIPLALDFGDGNISNICPVRVVMWVNGYQFGKYVSNIGPQTLFPVPEGIWNYQGSNTVAIELWAMGQCGGGYTSSAPHLNLKASTPIQSGYGTVQPAPQPSYTPRTGTYETTSYSNSKLSLPLRRADSEALPSVDEILGDAAALSDAGVLPTGYDTIWTTQSSDSSASMPAGGGDLGMNVWVENGNILLYLQQSGAFDENNSLLKLGRLNISMNPNPFPTNDQSNFKQHLDINNGYITISGNQGTSVKIWVDMDTSDVHISSVSDQAMSYTASFESWRTKGYQMYAPEQQQTSWGVIAVSQIPQPYQYPDTVQFTNGGVLQYHHNTEAPLFDFQIKQQGLGPEDPSSFFNPMRNNTFGSFMYSPQLSQAAQTSGKYINTNYVGFPLKSSKPSKTLQLIVGTNQQQTTDVNSFTSSLIESTKSNLGASQAKTLVWWNQFWNRSHIIINPTAGNSDSGFQVGKNYQYWRYMTACNAKGKYPLRFNGGLWNFDPSLVESGVPFTPDYRKWSGGTFTAQNQRLLYWPLLKTGDYDIIQQEFNYYQNVSPNNRKLGQLYFGLDVGVTYEQFDNTGLSNTYEYDAKQYSNGQTRDYLYPQGVDFNDYLSWLKDTANEFADMVVMSKSFYGLDISKWISFVEYQLAWFDQFYHRRNGLTSEGKLTIYPASGCETYKLATNPASTVSGLYRLITDLLDSGASYVLGNATYYEQYRDRVPATPIEQCPGATSLTCIAPAKNYSFTENTEPVAMYPVFPWGEYGLGQPTNLSYALHAYFNDSESAGFHGTYGWRQDQIWWARMGLTDLAQQNTISRLSDSTTYRFSAFKGPNYDWSPDINHYGSAALGLQEMLCQTFALNNTQIRMLGAWPSDWSGTFKLTAPQQTVVEGTIVNGKIPDLAVTPASRMKDVVFGLDKSQSPNGQW